MWWICHNRARKLSLFCHQGAGFLSFAFDRSIANRLRPGSHPAVTAVECSPESLGGRAINTPERLTIPLSAAGASAKQLGREISVQRERHVMPEPRDKEWPRSQVAGVEPDDLRAPFTGVEHERHHETVILLAACARGDEYRLARITVRGKIVSDSASGLHIDAADELLQPLLAPRRVVEDVGVAIAAGRALWVDARKFIGVAGQEAMRRHFPAGEIDAQAREHCHATRGPGRLPVRAQRVADGAVVGIAREIEHQLAVLLESVGEVKLEE